MDRYLEHVDRITTDENGKFTYHRLYPGEVAIYASLHSQDDAEILWKYCLESSFNCPKNPERHILKEPLVAEYSSMVNFDLLSASPRTNGSFIDPLKIKTLKTSHFQNTFVASKEFEQRLQVMHQLKKGSLLLDTYITHLSEPLWKCDKMVAEMLYGTERTIFENFAKERLTNVQNDGIHQAALLQYYSEQCMAFRSENEQRLNEYQSKTQEEITAMTKSIEAALNNPGQLAISQASHKGWGSAKGSSFNTNQKTTVRHIRRDSYPFSWASNAWCNIDQLLKSLGSSPWSTAVHPNTNKNDITVYQTLRELQTVIGLIKQDGSFRATSSRTENHKDIFCLAMYQDAGQLFYGGRSYDPKTTRDIDLQLVPVTDDEFYMNLCSLAPSESIIAGRMRTDLSMLRAHTKIKKKNEPFTRALESAKNEISSQVVVYNRLFDFLNRTNKNLVQ
jgi:hypothetical protein